MMDKELDRYELLAHPNPPNPVKAKAPPIGSMLADLAAQLRQSREMLLNGSCPTPQSVQEMMKHVTFAVEKSKGLVDDRLKETHGSSVKIAKLIDKVRPGRCAPPPDRRTDRREQRTPGVLPELASNMFQSEEAAAALRRAMAQHLVHSGSLATAEIFARVRNISHSDKPSSLHAPFTQESGESVPVNLARIFNQLRHITDSLQQGDIDPALQYALSVRHRRWPLTSAFRWVNENRVFLTERRSPLEFHLHRSRYLQLLRKVPSASRTEHPAFRYHREHLLPLYTLYPAEIDRLCSYFLWVSMGRTSSCPYTDLASEAAHSGLEAEFTKEYACCMQIGREAPLKILNRIGGGNALVRIEKGKKVMKERRGDWTNNDDLPVRPSVLPSILNPTPSSHLCPCPCLTF